MKFLYRQHQKWCRMETAARSNDKTDYTGPVFKQTNSRFVNINFSSVCVAVMASGSIGGSFLSVRKSLS